MEKQPEMSIITEPVPAAIPYNAPGGYNAAAVYVEQMPGNCPNGGSHEYADKFTTCGIVWAAVCFPCGLICCYNTREAQCRKCRIIEA